ncbi:MAG: succinate dehydrogenase cytochrome b558 subunit [Pirellulales bacterium]
MSTADANSFWARNDFLIRRLHSLSGLIPVGAYMVVHLLVNSTVLDSVGAFQRNVDRIHSLGRFLWVVEWGFIFLPLLFHAIVGVLIIRSGSPNVSSYPLAKNYRYTLQRVSGMIALFYIGWHVFHMHGWFHNDAWLENVAKPLGGHQFRAYNAASTAGAAIQHSMLVLLLYAVGIIACVFHLANGLWTMGITWGIWLSPAAQRRASVACWIFGLVLGGIGLSALAGMNRVNIEAAREYEDQHYKARVAAGDVTDTPEKRSGSESESTTASKTESNTESNTESTTESTAE